MALWGSRCVSEGLHCSACQLSPHASRHTPWTARITRRTQCERPHSNVAQESVVVAVVDDLAPNG